MVFGLRIFGSLTGILTIANRRNMFDRFLNWLRCSALVFRIAVFTLFPPLNKIAFFKSYLGLIEKTAISKNEKWICLIQTINVGLALRGVHFIFLTFQSSSSTDLYHTYHCDILHQALMPTKRHLNLLASLYLWMIIYMNGRLLFKPDCGLIDFLTKILLDQDGSIFLGMNDFDKRRSCRIVRRFFVQISLMAHSLVWVYGM